MDFTVKVFKRLLDTLSARSYHFNIFNAFIESNLERFIILRHDVDRMPEKSLEFARIESALGIKGTYYFRYIQGSFEENTIREISALGHEIGYHYEDLSFAWTKLKVQGSRFKVQGETLEKELAGIAIESFSENLEMLRKIVTVKTICMHGSPMSRWDSRLLWKYYDYRDFGIIGEPYFDIDFDQVLYLTDTGRCWNGESVSIRDKASGHHRKATMAESGRLKAEGENPYKDWKVKPVKYRLETKKQIDLETLNLRESETEEQKGPVPSTLHPAPSYRFHSTSDIIKAAQEHRLPGKIMITFHPQRWTDKTGPWLMELFWQNLKNPVKLVFLKTKRSDFY